LGCFYPAPENKTGNKYSIADLQGMTTTLALAVRAFQILFVVIPSKPHIENRGDIN
jgi:hypothetical protein